MDKDRIRELIEIMDEGGLTAIRIKDGESEIELERKVSSIAPNMLPMMAERVGELLEGRSASNQGLGPPALPRLTMCLFQNQLGFYLLISHGYLF